jgi:hypothetical protein
MKVQDAKAFGEKLGYIFGTVVICCVMALIIALTLKLLFLIF